MNPRATRWVWLAGVLLFFGCDESERAAVDPDASPAGGGTAVDGFTLEPWAVGDRWYVYDGRNHTLSPREAAYVVATDADAALFVVEGYYGSSGESGVFTVRHRAYDAGAWAEPQTVMFQGNVKDAPICIALGPWRQVPCEENALALVFRTDRRVLPAAGFVVANPALYEAGHPEGVDVELAVLERAYWEAPPADLDEALEAGRRPSVARSRSVWAIGLLGEGDTRSWLQAATSFSLVQWSAAVEGDTVRVRSRCVPLAVEPASQPEIVEASVNEAVLSVPAQGTTRLVRLCPEIDEVGAHEGFYRGTWPDSRDFDLLLEGHRDGTAARPAPGALIYQEPVEDPLLGGTPDVPASLWQ